MSPLHPSGKPQLRVSLGLLTVELLGRRSHGLDNSLDACSTARTPVQLVGHLFLIISSKLDSSDKLKTVLLCGYKALGD